MSDYIWGEIDQGGSSSSGFHQEQGNNQTLYDLQNGWVKFIAGGPTQQVRKETAPRALEGQDQQDNGQSQQQPKNVLQMESLQPKNALQMESLQPKNALQMESQQQPKNTLQMESQQQPKNALQGESKLQGIFSSLGGFKALKEVMEKDPLKGLDLFCVYQRQKLFDFYTFQTTSSERLEFLKSYSHDAIHYETRPRIKEETKEKAKQMIRNNTKTSSIAKSLRISRGSVRNLEKKVEEEAKKVPEE